MGRRARLDAELVRRGVVATRAEAARAIAAGRVLVNGAPTDKVARLVDPGDAVVLTGEPPRYVGRGGEKLQHAIEEFGLDLVGVRALDAGASTGGFTDCLLQHGAAHVVALDVGHGQLHPRIRHDPRVTVFERYNVRDLRLADIGGPVGLVVADLSFISLTKVLPVLAGAAVPGGALVLLVKPQFEAGRAEVARGGGIITDPAIHARVRDEVSEAIAAAGCTDQRWTDSPITGADGNREMLVHAVVRGHTGRP